MKIKVGKIEEIDDWSLGDQDFDFGQEASFSFSGTFNENDFNKLKNTLFRHVPKKKLDFIVWLNNNESMILEGGLDNLQVHFDKEGDFISISGISKRFYKVELLEWKVSGWLIEDKRWRAP